MYTQLVDRCQSKISHNWQCQVCWVNLATYPSPYRWNHIKMNSKLSLENCRWGSTRQILAWWQLLNFIAEHFKLYSMLTVFSIKMAKGQKCYWYLRTINSKFHKNWTKIEVARGLTKPFSQTHLIGQIWWLSN